MATGTLLTIDDFERLPSGMAKNHELVDGELVDVSGNTPSHDKLRDRLTGLLRSYTSDKKFGDAISEQEYDFLDNAYGPDVSFFGPARKALLEERRVQRFVPDLAIEIAPASDTCSGMLKKKDRYRAAGTQEVWLIFLETREVSIYGPEPRRNLHGADLLSTPLIPGFSISVDELFSQL